MWGFLEEEIGFIAVCIPCLKAPFERALKQWKFCGEYNFNFTTTIVVIIGRRLLDKVVYRIRLYIKANKSIAAIIEVSSR